MNIIKKTVPKPLTKPPVNVLNYSLIITAIFFVVALFGMLHHEMWRDEHQAWLIARDSHSLPQLFANMKYDGHPILWHLMLYFITCFTHNPAYMQVLHLLIACAFIFILNRYSEFELRYKILLTFGYFAIYEYAVISRDYGLAVMLIFIACALFKNRANNYILLGIILALLANVSIYGVIISLGIAGILTLDYLIIQKRKANYFNKFFAGIIILFIGVIFALYMIIPDKDNTFILSYPNGPFEFGRWVNAFSKIFTSYFCIPKINGIDFWNSTIFYSLDFHIESPLSVWFLHHLGYCFMLLLFPAITFISSLLIFIRKPFILLLYSGLTMGILSILYYTNLLWTRYTGFLFITLIICYWLAYYYPEKNYKNSSLSYLSNLGKKIQVPFLIIVLSSNVLGSIVAYYKSTVYEFTRSKDVVNYILDNRMDKLPIVGCIDYNMCALSTYLDKPLFYPQMNNYGSYCLWNKSRKHRMQDTAVYASIINFMNREQKDKLLFVSSNLSFNKEGKPIDHCLLAKDIKMDPLKSFDPGIVANEKYYLFLVQRADPKTEDLSQYPITWDDPNDVNYLINKGEMYGKDKNYQAAITEFEKAIAINPQSAAAYIDLSAAYGSIMQYEKGIECLKKAESIDPNNPLVPYFFGVTYSKMGDPVKGNEYKEKAKRLKERQQK